MNKKQILSLTVFVVILLLLISPDSYLYDLFLMGDSNVFYMSGKAWMNGMLPYVDFSDSKGPLLWLIYGVGYLLSSTSKVGVFWISCLWYVGIFLYMYRTARFYLDGRQSFFATLLMSTSFFFPFVHREIRAEDFCLLFICASLYETIRYLETHAQIARSLFVLGICVSATLLIKFNITAIIAFFVLCVLYHAVKGKEAFLKPCASLVLGFMLLFLPFMLYFLYYGIFQDFLYEYFARTLLTIQNIPDNYGIPLPLKVKIAIPAMMSILLSYVAKLRHKEIICLSAIFTLFVCNLGATSYYLHPLSVYWLFGFVVLIKVFQQRRWMRFPVNHSVLSMIIIVGGVAFFNVLRPKIREDLFLSHSDMRKYYHDVNYVMKQVEKPKVAWLHTSSRVDFSIPSEGLPANRYWFRQLGVLPDMELEQEQAVIARKPDFVFVHVDEGKAEARSVELLNQAGYHSYEQLTPEGVDFVMYGKELHQLPPKDYYYSDMDILLKR